MRPEKAAIMAEIGGQLAEADYVLLADYRGMTVERLGELRSRLRPLNTEVHVVKNTLFKQAAQKAGMGGALTFLEGPTAIVVGSGDVSAMAKMLMGFIKEGDKPVLKGGLLGETPMSAGDIAMLASIPSRGVLLGILAGALAAPISGLAGVMKQKLATLLYALKAIEGRKEQG